MPLDHADYGRWVDHHATLFLMRWPEDVDLFAAWEPLLSGFSFLELREASDHLASDAESASMFRTGHLAAIRDRITSSRREAERREQDAMDSQQSSHERCPRCRGAGVVSVPHPKHIADGRWTYPFASITAFCRCNLGAYRFNQVMALLAEQNERRVVLGLTGYESSFPDWQALVRERAAQRAAEATADHQAKAADKAAPIKPKKSRNERTAS